MKTSYQSELEYNKLHKEKGFQEEPEYYKMLGTLLKGKKSVDIGCGFGFIEMFSPETVGVDFAQEALDTAKSYGIKNLIKADAENLPFEDNAFEIAVSCGTMEHVHNIEKALSEMIRVSEIQINIIHAALPFGLEKVRRIITPIFGLKDQPIENPQTLTNIKNLLYKNGARVLVEGVWNYIDLRWINRNIPYGILKWPSHHFVVSIKTQNLNRRFLGDLINISNEIRSEKLN